ncbi:MAG: 16S rRNA (adenine(1518)-N(6)/adenine(1519)-N(6))-dimethyltransferase RsmA [Sphaerochaetaceae bacterium]|nr:16S rRNA (adenine(1518)-N(6)/adenine(1519)-N(6))-dimethyltransferase RsmA [Spirochaetales bacterium]MDY3768574.1 16S rRNA (adenine(1518)-N(6)/adenine(1519)-N(6))-dimethyltransferase RsmA [Sphaerochaetaceae bacterium]MDY5968091.1 16S rRNA (adenine(1518)-N(6)/adenine(1519)-N(6))-dimethyltransferase RsmA [Sphaerochaetaceae bacterium]
MTELDYSDVSKIKAVLLERGLSPTKHRGQNFLVSDSYRKKIADEITCSLPSGSIVWEIGPGLGSISDAILKRSLCLKAFELDYGFSCFLKEYYANNPNFSLVEGDALKTLFCEYEKALSNDDNTLLPEVICGNLPYNVGTVIIANALEKQLLPKRMVFTLQKEVAERLSAKPLSSEWGSLASLRELSYNAKIAFDIPPSAFYPHPKVTSSVVVLEKKSEVLIEKTLYDKFVVVNRALFSQKRKTVRNNLQQLIGSSSDEVLKNSKVDPSIRPEKLLLEDIINITKAIRSKE